MNTLTDAFNNIINNNIINNYDFTWEQIKKDAYNRLDVLNILLSEQKKKTYKYIDMVYYDLYKSIKPDISSFIPNTYEDDLVLLNIKAHDHHSSGEINTMKLAYIYDNIHSDNQTAIKDNKVYKTMSKNDAIEYCKEFVKFVETARKSPSRDSQLHLLDYKCHYNCENTEHVQGLYVKYRKFGWSDIFGGGSSE